METLVDEYSSPTVCRFCFEPGSLLRGDAEVSNEGHVGGAPSLDGPIDPEGGALISPCRCTGSQRYVHFGCLRRWQIAQVSTTFRHPPMGQSDAEDSAAHLKCSVCHAAFEGLARIRKVDILESSVGRPAVSALHLHSLLVSSLASSQITLPQSNDFLVTMMALRLAHWKYGVYFIYKYEIDAATGDGEIRALNLTRFMDGSVDKPIPDQMLLAQEEHQSWLRISHFNGGPVKWIVHRSAACVVNWDPSTTCPCPSGCTVMACPGQAGCWIILGMFNDVLEYLKLHHHLQAQSGNGSAAEGVIHLCTFSGYAQWTRHQLLGEMQRGKWRVLSSEDSLPVLRDACYSRDGKFVGDASHYLNSPGLAPVHIYQPCTPFSSSPPAIAHLPADAGAIWMACRAILEARGDSTVARKWR